VGCQPFTKAVLAKLPKSLRGTGCSYTYIPKSQFLPNTTSGKTLEYLISVVPKIIADYTARLNGSCLSTRHMERLQVLLDNNVNAVCFRIGICRNFVQRGRMYRTAPEKLQGMFPIWYSDSADKVEVYEAALISHFGAHPGLLNKKGTGGEHPPWQHGPFWVYLMVGNTLQIWL
jgi:hypothetical protein